MKIVPQSGTLQKSFNVKRASTATSQKRIVSIVALVAGHHHLSVLSSRLGLLKGTWGEARNTNWEISFIYLKTTDSRVNLWISTNKCEPLPLRCA